ncbi:hypothetical protein GDO81_012396 [Engystomops pustulosus]|uniref:Uncharacterized protein n=1 Tax=Engystomops pustulosus TaxID=76066 RepID=A0AAV7BLN3_ENGPU|nr:hypothetical protein GDO81_012396 [Engystomops pustulosus]
MRLVFSSRSQFRLKLTFSRLFGFYIIHYPSYITCKCISYTDLHSTKRCMSPPVFTPQVTELPAQIRRTGFHHYICFKNTIAVLLICRYKIWIG